MERTTGAKRTNWRIVFATVRKKTRLWSLKYIFRRGQGTANGQGAPIRARSARLLTHIAGRPGPGVPDP